MRLIWPPPKLGKKVVLKRC